MSNELEQINETYLGKKYKKINKIMLYVLSVIAVVTISVLYVYTRKPLTEKLYVTNLYGYLALSIILLSLSIIIMNLNRMKMNSSVVFLSFILGIVCMFGSGFVKNSLFRHSFWIVFIVCMSIILYPVYKKTEKDGSLLKVLSIVFILFVSISIYVYTSGNRGKFLTLGKYLTFVLFMLILFQILDLILFEPSNSKSKVYGIIVVILFSAFVLYETDLILTRAKQLSIKPNYPFESIGLFLDILNLFSGTSSSL